MDFIQDIFNLIPLKSAVAILFLTYFVAQQIGRDEKGRLPRWFTVFPLSLGVLFGVPLYLLEHAAELSTQAVWITVLRAGEQGIYVGAGAIGLWSARRLIPYFSKIDPEKDT